MYISFEVVGATKIEVLSMFDHEYPNLVPYPSAQEGIVEYNIVDFLSRLRMSPISNENSF